MIDTHAHLNDKKLITQVQQIVSDDLEAIMVVGYDYESSRTAVELSKRYDKIYAIVGCHPSDAHKLSEEELDYYRKVSDFSKVVAIGEIGLDYYHDYNPRDIQKSAFERQILLAHQLKLPIVLHVRDAYADTLEILERNKDKITNGVLVHCYSGSKETVREFTRYDAYFALGGAITYKNAKKDDVIKAIPLDRLVVETDAPYLTPTPKRGQLNEPKYVKYTIEKISEVLGLSTDEVERITTENAKRFFNLI